MAQNNEPWAGANDDLTGQGPGIGARLAAKAIQGEAPARQAPTMRASRGRVKASTAGHTTSGVDSAMGALADQLHPTG